MVSANKGPFAAQMERSWRVWRNPAPHLPLVGLRTERMHVTAPGSQGDTPDRRGRRRRYRRPGEPVLRSQQREPPYRAGRDIRRADAEGFRNRGRVRGVERLAAGRTAAGPDRSERELRVGHRVPIEA